MDDALSDPRCVATAEALVLDGANGVCRDARLGARDEAPWRAGALAVAVLVLVIAMRRSCPPIALAVLAAVLAIPGWLAIATERADRPTAIAASARDVERLHDAVRGFGEAHGCAAVTIDRCLACQPIAGLATAGLACDRPARVVLRAGALGGECHQRGDVLVCEGRR